MSDLHNLMDMGFSEAKCQKALSVNNNNFQEALEWLLVHGNQPDEPMVVEENPGPVLKLSKDQAKQEEPNKEDSKEEEVASANSLKCDDCGALLKDEDFATLHAHKTGHVNFSQSTESIKPKTIEEIEEQKKRLEEKLIRLRHERLEKEKQEQLEREKARRKEGRQLNEIKQKFQEEEMKRIAEAKRREKLEDAAYKRKVKEQIARDREAFKKEQQGQAVTETKPIQTPVQTQPTQEKKEYTECKIQIRLTDGSTMVHVFKPTEQLASVRLWIEMNRKDSVGKFNLMQTFPRKVYTEDDMMRTLTDLGLVPASSLVVTKV
ncbi:unnamed protein product [Brachionus calyciflorus]|uniref:UBX domain-containing protein 1 n=1 Tax=Brachionus calyciflorus TaxID=104777 RepID=A0A813P180_9BILA|nr:unnamed protein product [Brachionus calyciflorus]